MVEMRLCLEVGARVGLGTVRVRLGYRIKVMGQGETGVKLG